jgi:hypothetical protein
MRIAVHIVGFLLSLLYAFFPMFFWLGSLMLGLWIGFWSVSQALLDNDSQAWPTVVGQIQTASLQMTPGRFGNQNYWPNITYTYRVGQHTYTNDTIIFGQSGPATQAYAEGKVQQYRPGSLVRVAYNPQHPQDACLEPGQLIGQTYVALGIAVLFASCGIGGFVRQDVGRFIVRVQVHQCAQHAHRD